jgi:mono/diheme cytochrome c family protein
MAAFFRELCSVCHGAAGKGDGRALKVGTEPADFTNCKAMAKDSDDVLFKIIKVEGKRRALTVMPAWEIL